HVVGNLPYNISTPLLFHLMGQRRVVFDQVFMLQKEVVDRIVAPVGGADFGRLSVMMQSRISSALGHSQDLIFRRKNWKRFCASVLSSGAKCYVRTCCAGSVIRAWTPMRRVHWVLRLRLAPKRSLYRHGAPWR
ncbi:MAG: hypothetical protein EBS61_10590, partial [Betaproteobacteria bacterium]|nr:hypothetical protein [Betaproteobacteria bacterium]